MKNENILFKKIVEQIEVNDILSEAVTESEKADIEKKLIFGDNLVDLTNDIKIADNSTLTDGNTCNDLCDVETTEADVLKGETKDIDVDQHIVE